MHFGRRCLGLLCTADSSVVPGFVLLLGLELMILSLCIGCWRYLLVLESCCADAIVVFSWCCANCVLCTESFGGLRCCFVVVMGFVVIEETCLLLVHSRV